MAGYHVLEASNVGEAIRLLEHQSVDVVAAELALPPDGTLALLKAMRGRPEWESIPMLGLADSAEQMQTLAAETAGLQDCQAKFDQQGMLESLARLGSAVAGAEPEPVCAGEVK